jgi:hypothetical protein
MKTTAAKDDSGPENRYEPPVLMELGSVAELTLSGCFMDKKWGGSDGFHFMGISVPVSSC